METPFPHLHPLLTALRSLALSPPPPPPPSSIDAAARVANLIHAVSSRPPQSIPVPSVTDELAFVHAYALSASPSPSEKHALLSSVTAHLANLLALHIPSATRLTFASTPLHARLAVERAALRAASSHAGVPLILHLTHASAPPVAPSPAPLSAVRVVSLPSHESARAELSRALRDAVRAGEAPALLVFHAAAEHSLLPALPVARALCDAYGARLHVEGDALPLVVAPDAPLDHDPRPLLACAHSAVLDPAAWLAAPGCALAVLGVDPVEPSDDLFARVVALAYLLERVPLPTVRDVLASAVRFAAGVADGLYRVPALVDARVLGAGADLVVSYVCEDDAARARVHDAMSVACGGLFETRDDGLHFSAVRLLRTRPGGASLPDIAPRDACENIVRTARTCEAATAARAAFTTRMRQAHDFELHVAERAHRMAGLRVTPFGHVPPHGRWVRDDETRALVASCTTRLADAARDAEDIVVELEEGDLPILWVAPRLAGGLGDGDLAESCESVAREWTVADGDGGLVGVAAAEMVIELTAAIVAGIGVVDAVEDVADGVVVPEGESGVEAAADETNNADEYVAGALRRPKPAGERQDTDAGVSRTAVEAKGTGHGWTLEPDMQLAPPVTDESAEIVQATGATETTRAAEPANGRPHQKPSGLWGLIFGEKSLSDDAETSESEGEESKELEDDYFRP